MKKPKSNAIQFLMTYNELDKYLRRALNRGIGTSHSQLIDMMSRKNKMFTRHRDDLRAFARLRNVIVHNPDCRVAEPIAEPHDYIVKKYENIKNELFNPPIALNTIAVPSRDIFTTTMDARALRVMKNMDENAFTFVPVVQGRKMLGIFSESTVFSYLVKNQIFAIDENVLIKEFSRFIPIDAHENEYFEFVPKNTLVIDIETLFQRGLKNNKRISVIFITERGKQEEEILGLITPWDLVGFEEDCLF